MRVGDGGKCSIPSLGSWRSMFIYLSNMQFLRKNSDFCFCLSQQNEYAINNMQCAATFGIFAVINIIGLFCLEIISNSQRQLLNSFELSFFLFRATSLFTLRRFGAQIS
jgi:hypothetical protein